MARTDGERLDWLEENGTEIAELSNGDIELSYVDSEGWVQEVVAPTFREAIDAAMDATTEPEEEEQT